MQAMASSGRIFQASKVRLYTCGILDDVAVCVLMCIPCTHSWSSKSHDSIWKSHILYCLFDSGCSQCTYYTI